MNRWRRRTKRRAIANLTVLGIASFAFIAWLFTQVPWDQVSLFVFAVILVVVLGFVVKNLYVQLDSVYREYERVRRASHTQSVPEMVVLHPTDFEHYVATIYKMLGYTATVTRQSSDGGIDIILKNEDGRTAVQVKRYSDKIVGRPEINKLVGAAVHDFEKMIFVTTSDFTAEAYAEAQKRGVILVNGEGLESLAKQVFGDAYLQKTFSFPFQRRMLK